MKSIFEISDEHFDCTSHNNKSAVVVVDDDDDDGIPEDDS